MNISAHISYREATRSATAKRHGIRNTPNPAVVENMTIVAEQIFEPLRTANGNRPIRVNSFFRSRKLNAIVKGSKNSQHILGQAIDLDDAYGGMTNAEMFRWIVDHVDFDQIIWEYGNNDNPDWVHVSYVSEEENRRTKLRAKRKDGKTVFELIT